MAKRKEIDKVAAAKLEELLHGLRPSPETGHSNCISYWFPKLEAAGLPVPKTRIVQTEAQLIYLLDGEGPPETEAWERFQAEMLAAGDEIGYPLFLRSGHYSGKHSWRETCYVPEAEALIPHVAAIINDGECARFFGFPWDTWAVRELLPTRAVGVAFWGEMPVAREWRVFVNGGAVECAHPYWPFEALKEYGYSRADWERLVELGDEDRAAVKALAEQAGAALGDRWSVDILDTERDWYVTDVAAAEQSWHWPECPRAGTG